MPSGKLTVCELEHGPVEIVDLPIDSMVIFHSFLYVYQRVSKSHPKLHSKPMLILNFIARKLDLRFPHSWQ